MCYTALLVLCDISVFFSSGLSILSPLMVGYRAVYMQKPDFILGCKTDLISGAGGRSGLYRSDHAEKVGAAVKDASGGYRQAKKRTITSRKRA